MSQFRSSAQSMEEQCEQLRRSLNLPDSDAVQTGKSIKEH